MTFKLFAGCTRRRLVCFFRSLYDSLKRGARATLQFYPETPEQLELITSAAMSCGFTGGTLIDFPHRFVIWPGLASSGPHSNRSPLLPQYKSEKVLSLPICRGERRPWLVSTTSIGHWWRGIDIQRIKGIQRKETEGKYRTCTSGLITIIRCLPQPCNAACTVIDIT